MNRTLWKTACAAAVAWAMGGCTEDYPPFARLEALRVLAIQSEPAAPAFGETSVLTPLVYAPPGKVVSYAWSWCPFAGSANQGYPCLLPEAQLASLLGESAGLVPSYNLGNEATATFPVNFDPAALRPLCATDGQTAAPPTGAPTAGGAIPAVLDCQYGLPIQIKLVVTTDNDVVESVRTLSLRLDPNVPANKNPVISGIVATFKTDPAKPDSETFDVTFDEAGTVVLPRQKSTPMRALVTEDQAEVYTDPVDGEIKERLFLTWLVESGSTSPERSLLTNEQRDFAYFTKSKWTPASPKDYANTNARLFVIFRDNRGGVSWTSGVASLVVPQ